MRIRGITRQLLTTAVLAATIAVGAAVVTDSPAMAAGTVCKTVRVSGYAWQAINPRMDVPICYNGGSVWQSGRIVPAVSTYGYYVPHFDWYGSYGGGTSFGVGMNFAAHLWTNAATLYCTPRWTINTWGQVTSYNRNC